MLCTVDSGLLFNIGSYCETRYWSARLPKLVIFIFIVEMTAAPCLDRPVELVFLVDGSERLGQENFDLVRFFMKNVARSLRLASNYSDSRRARLAVMQYGGYRHHEIPLNLTHDLEIFMTHLEKMRYMDSSSDVGSAILSAVNHFLNGRSRRRHRIRLQAEVSFVFITDGVTATWELRESLALMRKSQVIPVVVAMGDDVDNEVVLDLALGDSYAVFQGPDYKHLSSPDFLKRFTQWVC